MQRRQGGGKYASMRVSGDDGGRGRGRGGGRGGRGRKILNAKTNGNFIAQRQDGGAAASSAQVGRGWGIAAHARTTASRVPLH